MTYNEAEGDVECDSDDSIIFAFDLPFLTNYFAGFSDNDASSEVSIT